MNAKSVKRVLAFVAFFVVIVMSFAVFSLAAIERDSVVLPLRRLTFYWYNSSNFQDYGGYNTSVSSPLHIALGSSQSSILQIYVDGVLTSFVPDNATSAWLEFDISVSSEALKGSDFPPLYGSDRIQFCEDLTTGSVVQLGYILSSQVDSDGDPYLTFWYKFKDKNGNTRLADLDSFAEWIRTADSASPYITYSLLVQLSPSVLDSFRTDMSKANIVRVLCNHQTTGGGYLDISPVVTMLYTYNVITPEDQYNQVNDLINGSEEFQQESGDFYNEFEKSQSGLDDLGKQLHDLMPDDPFQGISPDLFDFDYNFLTDLWHSLFFHSYTGDSTNILWAFAGTGLLTSIMFFILRT